MKEIDLNCCEEESNQCSGVNDNHGPQRGQISAILESDSLSVQSTNVEEVRQSQPNPNPPAQQRTSNPGRIHNRGAGNSYNNPIGRGAASQRASTRDTLNSGGRPVSRTTNRERGTSPSRRKALRQVDDRNKTTEPPPPH